MRNIKTPWKQYKLYLRSKRFISHGSDIETHPVNLPSKSKEELARQQYRQAILK